MPSRLRTVSVDLVIPGTPDDVFAVFNDYSGWKRWAGPPSVSLEREGENYPSGIGAIRRFAVIPPVREEIVAFEPPHTMSYTLLSGAPIKNHLGTVTFASHANGCAVHWKAQYEATIPGTAPIMDIGVRWFFKRILGRLNRFISQERL